MTQLTTRSTGLVIPAHNEEDRIGSTLENYLAFYNNLLSQNHISDYRIAVVINNTRDNTERIVREHQRANPKLDCLNFIQAGKGFAVMQGWKYYLKTHPELELLGFIDADSSTSPTEFYALSTAIDGHDGVIASRYLKGSIVNPKPQLKRLVASRVFNLWEKFLLGMPYKDTQCGAKIFKAKILEQVVDKLRTSRWAFDVELLYDLTKSGYNIREVPTVWQDRAGSKFPLFSAGLNAALDVLKIRMRDFKK